MNDTTTTFRTKFEKQIRSEQQRDKFLEIWNDISDQSPKDLLETLWRLTYYPKSILPSLGLRVEGNLFSSPFVNPNLVPISEELILPLRNELRHMYKTQKDNTFLELDSALPDSCKEAFINLKNKADQIIATAVLCNCVEFIMKYHSSINNSDTLSRTLFLLGDTNDANIFGGLRSMSFSKPEANYLKPFSKEILELLSAISDQKEHLLIEQFDSYIYIQHYESTEMEEQEVVTCFVSLTPSVIIDNKEIFISFSQRNFDSLIEIQNLGLDLNEVIKRRDEIDILTQALMSW